MIKIKMNNEIIKNAGFVGKGLKLIGKTFDATLRYPKTTILSGIYLFNDTVRESINNVVLETVTGEEQTAQYTPPAYATEKRDEIVADISKKVNEFCVKFSNKKRNLNYLLEYYSDGDSKLTKISENFCKELKSKLIFIGNRKKNSLNSLNNQFTEADKKFLRESIDKHIAKIEECCNTDLLMENLKQELDSDVLANQPELTEPDSDPNRMTVEERLEELRRSREEQVALNRGRLDRLREERENFEQIFKERETKAPRISSDTVDFLRRVEDKMSPSLFRKYSKLFKKTMNQAGMKFNDKSLSATSKREVKILMAATSGMMSGEEYNPKLLILDYLKDELGESFNSVYKAMEQEARQDMRSKSDDNYLKPNKLALFSKGFVKKANMNHTEFESLVDSCFSKIDPSVVASNAGSAEEEEKEIAKQLLDKLSSQIKNPVPITSSNWLKSYCSKPNSKFQTTTGFYSSIEKILKLIDDTKAKSTDNKPELVAQFILTFSGDQEYSEGITSPSYDEDSNWAKILNSLPDLVGDDNKIAQFEKNIKLAKGEITYEQYLGDDTSTESTAEGEEAEQVVVPETSDTENPSESPEETFADSSISADFNYSIESVKAALPNEANASSITEYRFKETYDNASKKGNVIADVTIEGTDENSNFKKTLSNAFSFTAKSAAGKSVWLHYYVSDNYHLFPAGKISGGMKVFATNNPKIPTGKYNITSTKPRINYGVCYIANIEMAEGLESENRNILSMIRRFNWGGKNVEKNNRQLEEETTSTARLIGFKPTISLTQANSIFREREGKRLTFRFNGLRHSVNAKKPAMIELDLNKKYKVKRRAIEDDGEVASVSDIYKALFSSAPNGHMYFSPAVAYALQQTDAAELQAYLKNIAWLRFIYSNPGLFPTKYNELLKQYRDNIVAIATKVINSLK